MSKRRHQGRSVTAVYGGISFVLLVVIAAVALVLAPPAPPVVAEFAPRAEDVVEDVRDNQSSRFGSGDGACAVGQECEGIGTTTTTARDGGGGPGRRVIEAKRVRRCVGNPPRQVEDPQSPPCVNYFDGDNGGATTKGVTRDEIRIAVPCGGGPVCDDPALPLFVEFFNRRFELYGRRLRVTQVEIGKGGSLKGYVTPEYMRSVAAKIGEAEAFAATSFSYLVGTTMPFRRELARLRIMSVEARPTYTTNDDLRDMAPFAWTYGLPLDGLEANLGEMACKSLVGRPAAFGGPDVVMATRKFGVTYAKSPFGAPVTAPLVERLDRCGARPLVVEYEEKNMGATMAMLQAQGVTSIVCVCGVSVWQGMQTASQSGYHPEWLLLGMSEQDNESTFASNSQGAEDQRSHTFGLSSRNKLLDPVDEAWYWAAKEVDPDYRPYRDPTFTQLLYDDLLVLASGIQMAGPRLTPQSFAAGLARTTFPNPGAGQAPYWQAHVGFGPNDFAMVDDVAPIWWDESEPNRRTTTGNGAFCYIKRGQRWSVGRWPDGPLPFFDHIQACR